MRLVRPEAAQGRMQDERRSRPNNRVYATIYPARYRSAATLR